MNNKTAKQRLEIYKKMLKWFEDKDFLKKEYVPCFCAAIKVVCGESDISDFPELNIREPIVYTVFWFPVDTDGIEKRKQILRKIIKEMS